LRSHRGLETEVDYIVEETILRDIGGRGSVVDILGSYNEIANHARPRGRSKIRAYTVRRPNVFHAHGQFREAEASGE